MRWLGGQFNSIRRIATDRYCMNRARHYSVSEPHLLPYFDQPQGCCGGWRIVIPVCAEWGLLYSLNSLSAGRIMWSHCSNESRWMINHVKVLQDAIGECTQPRRWHSKNQCDDNGMLQKACSLAISIARCVCARTQRPIAPASYVMKTSRTFIVKVSPFIG